jgi:hypothetical protein
VLGRTLAINAADLLLARWGFAAWQIQRDRSIALQGSRDDLMTMASSLSNELSAMIYDGVGAAMAAQRSNTAMDSTCAVCGNMSMTPALRS